MFVYLGGAQRAMPMSVLACLQLWVGVVGLARGAGFATWMFVPVVELQPQYTWLSYTP